jgi:ankyrin repeat protein
LNCATVHGATPAYAACFNGHIEILKLLHSFGADLTVGDAHGVTPLHAAVSRAAGTGVDSKWHAMVLEYLLSTDEFISKINGRDENGLSAIWY